MAPDPRQGLKKQLDLVEAYNLYEKDYPVKLPNINATLAINSPLYQRIQESLTEQTRGIAEHQADAAATRRISTEANVPYATLVQLLGAMRPPLAPPAAQSLSTAAQQTQAADDARLQAAQQTLLEERQRLERDRATAATAIQNMQAAVAQPINSLVGLLQNQTPQGPTYHIHNPPIQQHFHQYDQRQVDARQVHQQLVADNRVVQQNLLQDNRVAVQAVQDNRQVLLSETNITVDQRRFIETHINQINEYSVQNNVDIRVAAQILFANFYDRRRPRSPDGGRVIPGDNNEITDGQLAVQDGQLAMEDARYDQPTGPLGPRPKAKAKTRSRRNSTTSVQRTIAPRERTPRRARSYGRTAAAEALNRQL